MTTDYSKVKTPFNDQARYTSAVELLDAASEVVFDYVGGEKAGHPQTEEPVLDLVIAELQRGTGLSKKELIVQLLLANGVSCRAEKLAERFSPLGPLDSLTAMLEAKGISVGVIRV